MATVSPWLPDLCIQAILPHCLHRAFQVLGHGCVPRPRTLPAHAGPLLRRDPGPHVLVEYRQGDRPVTQDNVVETAEIEPWPEGLLRLLAQPGDLPLAQPVCQCLPRVHDV